ncbi:uncharacterized protein LOC134229847, partial [Saccostrea cucullata]|uniref:uncharacterized protein LOC134229847 n=1 Tax=Saccostrea cuccullata TaxID=36930 RepID=UPI002ED29BB1
MRGNSGIKELHGQRYEEIPVQLIPIVVDKDGAELQSSSFAQALRKCLLDFSAKASILRKVGRYFDYEVYEEKVRGNTSVNVLCRVTKESDLREFEERFYSDQLAKSLEQYLTSVGFHWDLNIGYGSKKKEFKLKVIIERKCFTQKPTDFSKISRASKLEVEDKLKRKHESEIGENTGVKMTCIYLFKHP